MANVRRKALKRTRRRSPAPRQRQRRNRGVKKAARGARSGRLRNRNGKRRVQGKGSRKSRALSRSRKGKARAISSDFNIPLNVPSDLQEIKFETYIKRLVKKAKPKVAIKKQSVQMMDNLMKDTLHQIAKHAVTKMGKKKTLQPRAILRAMKKLMPKSLVDRVDDYAQMALKEYDRRRWRND